MVKEVKGYCTELKKYTNTKFIFTTEETYKKIELNFFEVSL